MPLPLLTWVLCNNVGVPLPGGHVAQNRKLFAARNQGMEARLTLSLHDEAAIGVFAALRDGIPQLRVYLGTTLVFSGHWTPMRGTNSNDAPSTLELVFKDAFSGILPYRYTTATFTATDAGLIANSLISSTSAEAIDTDAAYVEATVPHDITYESKYVAEAITQLTEMENGFDWYPVYLDTRASGGPSMEFHVVARMGSDMPTALFEFGEGTLENCTSYSFVTELPLNWVEFIGAGGLLIGDVDFNSIARYEIYAKVLSATDVSTPAVLTAKARDALRPDPVHVTEFRPDPAVSPLPWEDFWVGDTIRWNVDDGAMQQQTEPRVQTIEIGVDDSDNISELVIGIDPAGEHTYLAPADSSRRFVQSQRDVLRRLNALER